MKVIPAIDIKDGKVVRLAQGMLGRKVVYSDSPRDVAIRWDSCGVELIHLVDLDGAFAGKLRNLKVAKEIVSSVKAKVELGGGVRTEKAILDVFTSGVDKAVIGTKALDEKFLSKIAEKYGDRIVVGVDARDGIVRTKGWKSRTQKNALDLIKAVERSGITAINYTDISRDGMLKGPNIESIREVLAATSMEVVVSGGVSSLDDLRRLKELEKDGLKGVIIGKALYENKIDLAEAMRICR